MFLSLWYLYVFCVSIKDWMWSMFFEGKNKINDVVFFLFFCGFSFYSLIYCLFLLLIVVLLWLDVELSFLVNYLLHSGLVIFLIGVCICKPEDFIRADKSLEIKYAQPLIPIIKQEYCYGFWIPIYFTIQCALSIQTKPLYLIMFF